MITQTISFLYELILRPACCMFLIGRVEAAEQGGVAKPNLVMYQ